MSITPGNGYDYEYLYLDSSDLAAISAYSTDLYNAIVKMFNLRSNEAGHNGLVFCKFDTLYGSEFYDELEDLELINVLYFRYSNQPSKTIP